MKPRHFVILALASAVCLVKAFSTECTQEDLKRQDKMDKSVRLLQEEHKRRLEEHNKELKQQQHERKVKEYQELQKYLIEREKKMQEGTNEAKTLNPKDAKKPKGKKK